jgi:hypothetical protein
MIIHHFEKPAPAKPPQTLPPAQETVNEESVRPTSAARSTPLEPSMWEA